MQTTLFKHMMKENAFKMCHQPITINPVTRLWRSIDANSYLRSSLSKFLKVAKIAIAMVLGFVQDERMFSTVSFMKSKMRNRLTTNLKLAVAFKSQNFFTLGTSHMMSPMNHSETRRSAKVMLHSRKKILGIWILFYFELLDFVCLVLASYLAITST
jgi:hypothetical protein